MDRVPGWRLLGSEVDGALEKLLLTDLSARRPGYCRLTALDLYRGYLRLSTNLDLSHTTLVGLDDDLLALFYRQDQPLRPPRFFSWKIHSHLAFLEDYLGARLILGRPPPFTRSAAYRWWSRLYDNWANDLAEPLMDDDSAPPPTPPRRRYFYALDRVTIPATADRKKRICSS